MAGADSNRPMAHFPSFQGITPRVTPRANDPRFYTPGLMTGTTSMPATDRSNIELKTQRLQAAKERQHLLKRHGAAASVLLHLALRRSRMEAAALASVMQRWRDLPARGRYPQLNAEAAAAAAAAAASPPSPKRVSQPSSPTRPPSSPSAEVVALRGELAAVRAQLATAHAAALDAGRQREEARGEVERALLRRELAEEWGWRLQNAERETQSQLVRHLYEKQELQARHHKQLQQAGFDRIDMLAQQEARAKVREGQLFDHALDQVQKLQRQLSQRSNNAEELVKLLHAQQQTESELETLRRQQQQQRASPRTPGSGGSSRRGAGGGGGGGGSGCVVLVDKRSKASSASRNLRSMTSCNSFAEGSRSIVTPRTTRC